MSICVEPGCPNIAPCPTHQRNPNSPNGRSNRNKAAHMRFARATKKRDGYQCRLCGSTKDLQAHHTHGVHDPRGITLCRTCHRAIDPHAR